MWYTGLFVLIIVALSVLLLGVKIFFTKEGKFPNTHIGGNEALTRKGITCAKTDDKAVQKQRSLFDRLHSEINKTEEN